MSNSFLGLRHHAVVGCNHQNNDIGYLSTASTHGREGFVSRGIQESNNASRGFNVVSTDVLCNTAGFACGNTSTSDVVQQRSLTVVNVTHNRHDRRTRFLRIVGQSLGFFFSQEGFRIFRFSGDRTMTHFFDHNHGRFLVKHLVDRHHLTELHHMFNDFNGLDAHLHSEISDSDGFRNFNVLNNGFLNSRSLRSSALAFVVLVLVLVAAFVAAVILPAAAFFRRVVAAAGLESAAFLIFVAPVVCVLSVVLRTFVFFLDAVLVNLLLFLRFFFLSRFLSGQNLLRSRHHFSNSASFGFSSAASSISVGFSLDSGFLSFFSSTSSGLGFCLSFLYAALCLSLLSACSFFGFSLFLFGFEFGSTFGLFFGLAFGLFLSAGSSFFS